MKSDNVFRVLAFGDLIGEPGRIALSRLLQKYKNNFQPDMIIANGENAAHGFGITEIILKDLLSQGIDVITSGNHIWHRKEIFKFMDNYDRLLRPINYPAGTIGKGSIILEKNGIKVGVINALGRTYMEAVDCPFSVVSKEIEEMKRKGVKIILVDFHAEATSEKQVFGRYFDGQISMVWGTHTHVQTADETIFPGGTGYISDIGMCGAINSVIGMKISDSVRRVIKHLPVRFSPEDTGIVEVQGIMIDIDKSNGKTKLISRIKEQAGELRRDSNQPYGSQKGKWFLNK